jgi:FlaG/FlaF family flagellin (archaellin)
MTKLKTIVVLAGVIGVVALGAAQASAASAPIVIPYAKTCNGTVCDGTAGDGGKLHMEVTGYRATGDAAQLTLTEWITVGNISFRADMNGTISPDGFIVLNGTVTEGSFAGAQVHQRSNLVGSVGTSTVWTGKLQLVSASA